LLDKKCNTCNLIKTLDNFIKCKTTKDQLTGACKSCINISNRKSYNKYKKTYNCKLCNNILLKFGKYCEPCYLLYRKQYRKDYEYNRRHKDLEYKIKSNISRSVRSALKAKGKYSVLKYLPYTIEKLITHIESLFESWMSWDNLGVYNKKYWNDNDQTTWKWQIDHIMPHSTFNYISMDDQLFIDCWSLKNLRPLSAKLNILKSNKLLG
jgi:hypothetical protein